MIRRICKYSNSYSGEAELKSGNRTNTIMNEGKTCDILFDIPGLSAKLAAMPLSADTDVSEQRQHVPSNAQTWFPLLNITSSFPKTLAFHGVEDTAIPIQDGEVFARELQRAGVDHRYIRVEGSGSGHGFDRENVQHWWNAYLSENLAWLLKDLE